MRLFLFMILVSVFSLQTHDARAAQARPARATPTEGIAATVGGDAISMSDFNNRLYLTAVSSGMQPNDDVRRRLAPTIINTLIEEQLMMQEAERLEIKVEEAEIDAAFAKLAAQNKFTAEQFSEMVRRSGISPATMRRQIKAQIAWGKVVQKVLRPRIIVTDSDIDEYLARLKGNVGKTEYLVAEIFLPVDSPKQDKDMLSLGRRLVSEMKAARAPFFKVAQQFSKAPGAEQGGDRGWVQAGQLDDALDAALKTMKPGDLSDVIRTAGGYHILMLRELRTIAPENMPDREKVMGAIGLQRLERAARGYLMNLKSSAFIENRVQ